MALLPGTRFGVYEITDQIGAGGMGEVYRATDTRLKRSVAVKVLPGELAANPERLARFQREAEVLAALNHPNIAAIYGVEGNDGATALVMELVEGQTLAERIAQGPIPAAEVKVIARQIAEALEAAHDQGIIHRDLKPANVKIRPDGIVKVLDFGLAKSLERAAPTLAGASLAATIAAPATTMRGVIQGTPAYMSPEQARGRPVDRRADIWAFGAVLFEMLAGRPAFPGDDVTQVLARVIEREPDWNQLPSTVPAPMAKAIAVCLRKDPKERVADLSAVRLAMDGAFDTEARQAPPAERTRRPRSVMAAAAAGLAVGAVAGALWWRASAPAAPAGAVARFSLDVPAEAPVAAALGLSEVAVSPDGTRMAYGVALGPGEAALQIYVRELGDLQPRLLRGTEGGGTAPFFSPDGESIGFVDARERAIKRVAFAGGTAQTIATFERMPLATDWGPDDSIWFVLDGIAGGLRRVPASGGDAQTVTTVAAGDVGHAFGEVLPGGGHVLFSIIGAGGPRLAIASIETGAITELQLPGFDPSYSASGHIVYSGGEGTLAAVGFDLDQLSLTSRTPQVVLENVNTRGAGANFDLADNGTLVYMAGVGDVAPRTLVWADEFGREEATNVPVRAYTSPRVSPDSTRVVVAIDGDLWVSELARPGTLRRVTTDPARERFPLWTPDGQRIVFESNKNGTLGIYSRSVDGRGDDQALITGGPPPPRTPNLGQLLSPEGWTADGRTLLFIYRSEQGDFNVGTVLADGSARWQPLLDTGAAESNVVVSPDGRHIAYEADDSGQPEVYVESFPALGGRQVVSSGGGKNPVWSRDGTRLFYRRGVATDGTMMVSSIQPGASFTPGAPRELFAGPFFYTAVGSRTWDISRDGRFLMMKSVEDAANRPRIVVVQNWFEELRRLARMP